MATAEKGFQAVLKKYIESEQLTLPIFNPVAMQVQMELVKEDPDMRALGKLIMADQSLSSKVIKLANSPLYGGLAKVENVQTAIVRLGFKELGRLILHELSRKPYHCKDPQLNNLMKNLWQHSVGCAFGAGWLSDRLDFGIMQNEAFFAGLLHDVGKLLILMILEQKMVRDRSVVIKPEFVLEAMTAYHAEQGFRLMQQWKMPDYFCQVARDHHLEEIDGENYLLILVRFSNLVCRKLGIGLVVDDGLDLLSTREGGILNLTETDLADLETFLQSSPSLLD